MEMPDHMFFEKTCPLKSHFHPFGLLEAEKARGRPTLLDRSR